MLESSELLTLTTRIVMSYLGGNRIAAGAVPDLIKTVSSALVSVQQAGQAPAPEPTPVSVVPIRKSVAHDAITCLECGQRLKLLRRHLSTDHGM